MSFSSQSFVLRSTWSFFFVYVLLIVAVVCMCHSRRWGRTSRGEQGATTAAASCAQLSRWVNGSAAATAVQQSCVLVFRLCNRNMIPSCERSVRQQSLSFSVGSVQSTLSSWQKVWPPSFATILLTFWASRQPATGGRPDHRRSPVKNTTSSR